MQLPFKLLADYDATALWLTFFLKLRKHISLIRLVKVFDEENCVAIPQARRALESMIRPTESEANGIQMTIREKWGEREKSLVELLCLPLCNQVRWIYEL